MKKLLFLPLALLAIGCTGCGIPIDCPKGDLRGLCTTFFPDPSSPPPSVSPEEVQMLESELAAIKAILESLNADIELLQTEFVQLASKLALHQLGEHVVAVIDPCGPHKGHDELLLKTASGKVLAWLKDVGLVELKEGVTYRTTDTQNCIFQIMNSQVVW
jgi:hypothetical protein